MPEQVQQPLTEQQTNALAFIREYILKHGRGPSVREIGEHLGLSSPNNAVRVVKAIKDAGHLPDEPGAPNGRPRALEVVTVPRRAAEQPRLSLPILGAVAAGSPLEIWEPDDDSFDFGSAFGGEGRFMVRVRGNSMIERHIAPGDLVVVRKSDTAEHGDEVIAEVDGGYTLKIYQESRTGQWSGKWLFPANKEMQPIRLNSKSRIVGIVEGVIRRSRKRLV